MTDEKVIKEFRKKFVIQCSDGNILDGMVDAKKVENFILSALQQQREEMVKAIDNEIDPDLEFHSTEFNNGMERAIEIIKNK